MTDEQLTRVSGGVMATKTKYKPKEQLSKPMCRYSSMPTSPDDKRICAADVVEGTRAMEMELRQAEVLLGEDVVIGRAMTWRMSKYLCDVAGQHDPAEYWAYAVWDDAKPDWIEPAAVFRRLSDLVAHYQSMARQNVALPETSFMLVHSR